MPRQCQGWLKLHQFPEGPRSERGSHLPLQNDPQVEVAVGLFRPWCVSLTPPSGGGGSFWHNEHLLRCGAGPGLWVSWLHVHICVVCGNSTLFLTLRVFLQNFHCYALCEEVTFHWIYIYADKQELIVKNTLVSSKIMYSCELFILYTWEYPSLPLLEIDSYGDIWEQLRCPASHVRLRVKWEGTLLSWLEFL